MLAGSPAEIRQQIDRYIAVGVTSIIISLSAPYDYEAVHRLPLSDARFGNDTKGCNSCRVSR
jgi:hypothetical protein